MGAVTRIVVDVTARPVVTIEFETGEVIKTSSAQIHGPVELLTEGGRVWLETESLVIWHADIAREK